MSISMHPGNSRMVSFRLPMEDYTKMLQMATDRHMTLTEYALLRVHQSPDRAELTEAEQRISDLSEEATGLRDENEGLRKQLTAHTKAVTGWQAELDQHRQALTHAEETARSLVTELEAARQKEAAAGQQWRDLRADLAYMHNGSGLLAKMPERYWEIVEKYAQPNLKTDEPQPVASDAANVPA